MVSLVKPNYDSNNESSKEKKEGGFLVDFAVPSISSFLHSLQLFEHCLIGKPQQVQHTTNVLDRAVDWNLVHSKQKIKPHCVRQSKFYFLNKRYFLIKRILEDHNTLFKKTRFSHFPKMREKQEKKTNIIF